MSWTQTTIDELVTLWRGGYSASEIAGRLGPTFTRNAVLGKVHRLGIAERGKPATQAKKEFSAKARAARWPGPTKSQKPLVAAPPTALVTPPAPIVKRRAFPERVLALTPEEIATATRQAPQTAIGLLELRSGQCRWPYGAHDFVFCGAPGVSRTVNKLPCQWCATHARIAYAPRPQPAKRGRPATRGGAAAVRELAF